MFQCDEILSVRAPITWHDMFNNEIDLFTNDPAAYIESNESEKYLVLKANIHVTLALTKLRLV